MATITMNINLEPKLAELELGRILITYSYHAQERAKERNLPTPPMIKVAKGMVVEVEMEGKQLTKMIARLPNGARPDFDLVLVLVPQWGGNWFAKSLYENHKDDWHATLDTGRIAR